MRSRIVLGLFALVAVAGLVGGVLVAYQLLTLLFRLLGIRSRQLTPDIERDESYPQLIQ